MSPYVDHTRPNPLYGTLQKTILQYNIPIISNMDYYLRHEMNLDSMRKGWTK